MPSLKDVRGKMVLLDYDKKVGEGLQIPNTKDNTLDEPGLMPKTMDSIAGSNAPVLHFGGNNNYKLYVQNEYDSPTKKNKLQKFSNNLNNSISGKAENAFIYNFLSAYKSDTGVNNLGSRYYSNFLNPLLPKLLDEHKGTSQTGNLILDFMTPQLAKAIYETNDPDYFPQIKLTTTPAQDADLPLTTNEREETICVGCVPKLSDSGITTEALIYNRKGTIAADSSKNIRKILESLSFDFRADEPVKWSLTGAASADFKLDTKSDYSTTAQLNFNSDRSEIGNQSSLKDDYSADLSTTGFIELSNGTVETISGIVARPGGDSELKFAVEAVDRYRNYSISEFDITIEASASSKAHDIDWIRVGLEKDRPVKFDTLALTLGDTERSKLYMTGIYDEGGAIVEKPVNSDETLDTFTAPANGYYYIGLSANNAKSDLNYTLNITPLDGLPHDPDKNIEPTDDFTETIEGSGFLNQDNNYHQFGSIETIGDIDWFGIELEEGTQVDFGFALYSHDPGISENAVIHAIYDNAAKQVGEIHDRSFVSFVAPKSDTYYVAVTSDTENIYEIGATINHTPSETVESHNDNDYSADISTTANLDVRKKINKLESKIDHVADRDWIRVGLEEGKPVDIEIEAKDQSHTVFLNQITDSEGETIKGTGGATEFTAPRTDFYYFEIASVGSKTGKYSVNLVSRSGKQFADKGDIRKIEDDGLIDNSGEEYLQTMPKRYRKRFALEIDDFNVTADHFVISEDFETTESGQSLAKAKGRRKVKKSLSRFDDQFLYDEMKGFLYFNENQSDAGFGDGGLIAIFNGAPELSIDNFKFM